MSLKQFVIVLTSVILLISCTKTTDAPSKPNVTTVNSNDFDNDGINNNDDDDDDNDGISDDKDTDDDNDGITDDSDDDDDNDGVTDDNDHNDDHGNGGYGADDGANHY